MFLKHIFVIWESLCKKCPATLTLYHSFQTQQPTCSSLSSNASFPASLNLEQRTRGANRVRYASASNNHTHTQTHTRLTGQSFETYSISLSIWSLSPPQTSPVTSLLMADLNPPLTGLCYPGSGEMQIDSRSEVAFFEGLSILRALSFQARLEESQVNVSLYLPRWVFLTSSAAQTVVCLIWGSVSRFLTLLCLSHMKIRYCCIRWVIDSYQTWVNIEAHIHFKWQFIKRNVK